MTLELPPLRSYKDNLEVLAQRVPRARVRARTTRTVPHISPAALAALAAYDFPGNVRELRNAIEHAVILADGDTIEPSTCRARSPRRTAPAATKKPKAPTLADKREEWLAPLEAQWLAELLDDSRGSVRTAAKRAGVDAVTLYRLLKKRGISFGRSQRPHSS